MTLTDRMIIRWEIFIMYFIVACGFPEKGRRRADIPGEADRRDTRGLEETASRDLQRYTDQLTYGQTLRISTRCPPPPPSLPPQSQAPFDRRAFVGAFFPVGESTYHHSFVSFRGK